MGVLVGDRKESKLEPIIFSEELSDILIDLMCRNFGIKNLDESIKIRYAYGEIPFEDFEYYHYLLRTSKDIIIQLSHRLTNNLRGAKAIHPVSLAECDQRREFLNCAIVNCKQIERELQEVINRFYKFGVDINKFAPSNEAIKREIALIKKWRQRDNKIKSRILQG